MKAENCNCTEWALQHLGEPKSRRGAEWIYPCPFHQPDNNPSFALNTDKGVYNCQACGATGHTGNLADKLGVAPPPKPGKPRRGLRSVAMGPIEATYSYTDENGNELFQCVRYRNPKDFRQRRSDGNGKWIWNLDGVRRVLYHLPDVKKEVEARGRVFITEGEKDADRVRMLGLTATCNVFGASKRADHQGKKWLPQYTETLRGAEEVVLFPDHDKAGMARVQYIANTLHGIGIPVKVVPLFEGELTEDHGRDIADWLEEGHGKVELLERVAVVPRWQPGMFPELVPDVVPEMQEGTNYAHPMGYVEALLRKFHVFTHDATGMYVYQNGCYRLEGADNVLKKELQAMYGGEVRRHKIEEVLYQLAIKTYTPPEKINAGMDGIVNCQNGLYDVVEGVLKPHSPDYLSTIQLPVSYDPSATHPTLTAFLQSIVPADDPACVDVLCEVAGYCLATDTRAEKIIMLTGNGANGKSTYLNLLKALLGTENISSVQLQELEESRFKQAELFGKLANVFPDLQDRPLDTTGIVKTLATGESINVERKHKDPFDFISFAKLIFSANKMPQSRDLSYAYFRRWLIIPFVNRFEGKDRNPTMKEEITTTEALTAFLNMSIAGLERLLNHNYQFTQTPSTTAALNDYRQRNDSALYYIGERCEVEAGGRVPRETLYKDYKSFCDDHGIRPMSARRFNDQLRENYPNVTPGLFQFGDGKRRKGWDGLKMADNTNE